MERALCKFTVIFSITSTLDTESNSQRKLIRIETGKLGSPSKTNFITVQQNSVLVHMQARPPTYATTEGFKEQSFLLQGK